MTAYIIRRLLLIIPTMFGMMLVTFVVVQFAPGGPVERVIAQSSPAPTPAPPRASRAARRAAISARAASRAARSSTASRSKYRGAQGLDPNSSRASRSSSASTSRRTSASS